MKRYTLEKIDIIDALDAINSHLIFVESHIGLEDSKRYRELQTRFRNILTEFQDCQCKKVSISCNCNTYEDKIAANDDQPTDLPPLDITSTVTKKFNLVSYSLGSGKPVGFLDVNNRFGQGNKYGLGTKCY